MKTQVYQKQRTCKTIVNPRGNRTGNRKRIEIRKRIGIRKRIIISAVITIEELGIEGLDLQIKIRTNIQF